MYRMIWYTCYTWVSTDDWATCSAVTGYRGIVSLDPSDPAAPYRQIAADLRQRIASGDLGPGERLPSARELMDVYDVATQTVQNAFRLLRGEDLIYSVQGRGTFVRDDLDLSKVITDEPTASYYQIVDQLAVIHDAISRLTDRVAALEQADSRAEGS